jgi:hypothetical protein
MAQADESSADQRKRDAERFFDRSRQSAFELLKLLVGLSTGAVAGYFAMLRTGSELSGDVRAYALAALLIFAGSTVAGLIGWVFDARFYERWGQSLVKPEESMRDWSARNTASRVRRVALGCAWLLFIAGVLLSGYLAAMLAQASDQPDLSIRSSQTMSSVA